MNSMMTVVIVVMTISFVSYLMRKIKLNSLSTKPVIQYLVRASIGFISAFFLAGFLYFILTPLTN